MPTIAGFPTIKFLQSKNGKISATDYQGGRTAAAIVEGALAHAAKVALGRIGASGGGASGGGAGGGQQAGCGAGGEPTLLLLASLCEHGLRWLPWSIKQDDAPVWGEQTPGTRFG